MMSVVSKCACLALGIAGLLAAPCVSIAATTNVPPVVVSSLAHSRTYDNFFNQTYVQDAVFIPSGGGTYSGPGFSASIGTGDTVIVRVQAPAGQMFNLTPPTGATLNVFAFNLFWHTGVGDAYSNFPTPTVAFENYQGPAMTNTYSRGNVSDAGQATKVEMQYNVNGACAFSAIQITFPVNHALASSLRNYNAVNTSSAPALSATAVFTGNTAANPTVMSIVPLPVPGACCHGTTCAVALPAACTGANALFLGANVACNPIVRGGTANACCPADFDNNGISNVTDLFTYISTWFAGCP